MTDGRSKGAVPLSDLASRLIDPVLRRRTGISVGLVQNWDEIVGSRLATTTRPDKIVWPRRISEDDPFEPATLVIACAGVAALHVQHETAQIIDRVNAFLGFAAVGRVRIVQKHVENLERIRPGPPVVPPAVARRIDGCVMGIEDEGLRDALARLGRSVAARRAKG